MGLFPVFKHLFSDYKSTVVNAGREEKSKTAFSHQKFGSANSGFNIIPLHGFGQITFSLPVEQGSCLPSMACDRFINWPNGVPKHMKSYCQEDHSISPHISQNGTRGLRCVQTLTIHICLS